MFRTNMISVCIRAAPLPWFKLRGGKKYFSYFRHLLCDIKNTFRILPGFTFNLKIHIGNYKVFTTLLITRNFYTYISFT